MTSGSPSRFRKKPLVIEAAQLTEDTMHEVAEWCGGAIRQFGEAWSVRVPTLEGELFAAPGSWIIKGVKGEFYPCEPEIFAETYEPVDV